MTLFGLRSIMLRTKAKRRNAFFADDSFNAAPQESWSGALSACSGTSRTILDVGRLQSLLRPTNLQPRMCQADRVPADDRGRFETGVLSELPDALNKTDDRCTIATDDYWLLCRRFAHAAWMKSGENTVPNPSPRTAHYQDSTARDLSRAFFLRRKRNFGTMQWLWRNWSSPTRTLRRKY